MAEDRRGQAGSDYQGLAGNWMDIGIMDLGLTSGFAVEQVGGRCSTRRQQCEDPGD